MKKTTQCRNFTSCRALIYNNSRTGFCDPCYRKDRSAHRVGAQVIADRAKEKAHLELKTLKKRYDDSLKTITQQEKALGAMGAIKNSVETFKIEPKLQTGTSEATVFWIASDWHVEERVDSRTISGLNTYNLEIAKNRATQFFQSTLRLTKILEQDVKISTVVLALLGDFISGDIHEEVAEVAEIPPTDAIVFAQNLIISGIEFVLNNSKVSLVVPCHSGNHARTTKTTRFSTESGHSLEYLLYLHLASYFRNEPRVTFMIAEGPHSYLTVYDKTVRFQHGHMVKYGGGVGGIYIPVNKAIAQWSKARHADLDVFGHFHQLRDGGNFLCNGSMIGYNGFALSIKADYEPPRQTLFLMDKKRGRTCVWPVVFDK